MELIKFPIIKNIVILALGPESVGVFAVYRNGGIFISENFGDLLDESNFLKFKEKVLLYLRKEKIKPDIILTDLHPLYKTTVFGEGLALRLGSGQACKKYSVSRRKITKLIKVQHHIAHIFSAVGDNLLQTKKYRLKTSFLGIAMDGTGYGLDGSVWGGEIFEVKSEKLKINKVPKLKIIRIGSLEEQIMIGGDLAVSEPARMLIAILSKIPNSKFQIPNKFQVSNSKIQKDFIYKFVKKFYTRNEFELLYSQMEQNFNCQKTTSTGRVLDAVSVLLGFSGNERNFKHEATKKLEKNSSIPYEDIESRIMNHESRKILDTTYLFEYLIKNIHKDKRRLAATAQLYIAKGLYEIIKNHNSCFIIHASCFAAGGMTNNKIISSYFEKQEVYLSKKIPCGDEGIAIGQIVYYLLNNH